jgi:predicted DNA-binding transcriptional regulator
METLFAYVVYKNGVSNRVVRYGKRYLEYRTRLISVTEVQIRYHLTEDQAVAEVEKLVERGVVRWEVPRKIFYLWATHDDLVNYQEKYVSSDEKTSTMIRGSVIRLVSTYFVTEESWTCHEVAKACGCSYGSARRHVEQLVVEGIVEVVRRSKGGRKATLYRTKRGL